MHRLEHAPAGGHHQRRKTDYGGKRDPPRPLKRNGKNTDQTADAEGGFGMRGNDRPDSMSDTLIIAISQSGTTTDTNRTVDLVRGRGARTLAIVNRRDSDITFKVDGVMYTSSGRDIEMSVASTKTNATNSGVAIRCPSRRVNSFCPS